METTRDLYSLNLFAKQLALLRQILFTLAITVVAEVILKQISAKQVPPLDSAAPRYLILVTSNFWPFTVKSALKLFLLLVMILLVSVLTSVP